MVSRVLSQFAMSFRHYLFPTLLGVGVMASWEFACRIFRIADYIFPSPSIIATRVFFNFGYLFGHSATTFFEALCGLCLAFAVGFCLGALFAVLPSAEQMALPYFVASQAVPIVAIAPLFILWFGNGLQSKILMAALMCFFPIVVGSSRGLKSVSEEQLDLFRVHAASKWQVFTMLRLPASIPHVLTGLRVSAALAMIGAIVAEYAGADKGIGYVIMQATYRLDTPLLFSAISFSALGGLLMFGGVVAGERFLVRRYTYPD